MVDRRGFVYVCGWTEVGPSSYDAFVAKLSPDGQRLMFSRRLGGSGFEIAMGLAVDPAGGVYVVGITTSPDFPVVGGFQRRLRGTGDAFIAKVSGAGRLEFSSYYGGSASDGGLAVAIGPTGAIYVAGTTASDDLPRVNGVQTTRAGGFLDGYVLKLSARHRRPVYASYLGGSQEKYVSDFVVDAFDRSVVVGNTNSPDFPLVAPLQPVFGGVSDGFVLRVAPRGAPSSIRLAR